MKQAQWWSAAILTASLALPTNALAQGKGKKPKPAAAAAAPAPAPAAGGATDGGDLDDPKPADPAGASATGAATAGGDATGAASTGGGGGICEVDPAACEKVKELKAGGGGKEISAEIYAVQQIYALRNHRLELNPYWSFTLNDQFVSHPGPGLAANYYLSNVLAAGLNFNYYGGLNVDSDFNFQNRRAARIGVPLNEYLLGVNLNMTYVPVYGKFAVSLGDFIFHYDLYTVGGLGALWTRPIPVIDPDNRKFDYDMKVAFNAGLGLRIFFNRWFAVNLELRDYIYIEKLEKTTVPATTAQQQDRSQWFGENKLTNNIQAQLGVSIFLPPSWEYRLPK